MSAVDYSHAYDPDADFDRHITHATGRRIRRWFRPGDRVLELGCATGLMTSLFVPRGVTVTGVDRSPTYLAAARARGLANASFHQDAVETFEPGGRFEHVVATHILNELEDPGAFLARCRQHLVPGGLLHVTLTNPRSLHRMIAVELGMIEDVHAQSALGAQLSTRQIFDGERLLALGAEAGLLGIHREPLLLKPFTNAQLSVLPDELIEGLDRVARHLPEHGALNYVIFVEDDAA